MNFLKDLWNSTFKNVPSTSETGTLNYTDVLKLVRDAGLVGAAALITYVVDNLNPELVGVWTPVIVTSLTVLLKAVQRLMKNNTAE